jgi:hypothetical protein
MCFSTRMAISSNNDSRRANCACESMAYAISVPFVARLFIDEAREAEYMPFHNNAL